MSLLERSVYCVGHAGGTPSLLGTSLEASVHIAHTKWTPRSLNCSVCLPQEHTPVIPAFRRLLLKGDEEFEGSMLHSEILSQKPNQINKQKIETINKQKLKFGRTVPP